MSSLFNKPKGNLNAFQKRQLHDVQFSAIKDALRKKNKAKAQAESVVMEWWVFFDSFQLEIIILKKTSAFEQF